MLHMTCSMLYVSFYFAFLTLMVKFLGNELDRLPGKLIHQKIMSIQYSKI